MRRRMVLAAMSALLAGCTDATDPGDGSTATSSTRTTTTATSTETTTEQPYALLPPDPASMTSDEVQERLGDRECATLTDLPATCPGDDGRLNVSVSPTVTHLAGGTVEFTLGNLADEEFQWNPWAWMLWKWGHGQWRRITPRGIPDSGASVAPGGSQTYRIELVDSNGVQNGYQGVTPWEISVGGLGPGVYGFTTRGRFESTPDDELAPAAPFGLAGVAPPIRPTDAVSHVKRDGSELVVRAYEPGRDLGEFAVSLVDGDPDARLLPEHVHQLAALRNSLSYAATDGVETIRCVTNRYDALTAESYLPAVTPEGTTRYGFRDLVFEFSVEEL